MKSTDISSTRTHERVLVPVVTSDAAFEVTNQDPANLLEAIKQSLDKLLFVSFRPEVTLRARWYLVSVDLSQTKAIAAQHGDPGKSGIYYVHFFAQHPAHNDETDLSARWWPEWREYSTGVDGVIDYSVRVLSPQQEYRMQTDSLHGPML